MTAATSADIGLPGSATRDEPSGVFVFAAVAAVVGLALIFTWPVIGAEQGRDWVAYAQAAQRLRVGGPLYTWVLSDPAQGLYLYPPPLAALWAAGLGPVGLMLAKLAAILGLAPLGAALVGPAAPRRRIASAIALTALGLAAAPVVYDLVLGNVMTL